MERCIEWRCLFVGLYEMMEGEVDVAWFGEVGGGL